MILPPLTRVRYPALALRLIPILVIGPSLSASAAPAPSDHRRAESRSAGLNLTPRQSFARKFQAATTPAERAEVMGIERALGGGQDITPEMRARYWQITDKAHLTPQELQVITGLRALSDYKVNLYQDALVALRTGKPYLSPQRAAEERAFLANVASEPVGEQKADFATQRKNLAQDHLIISNIANGKPVPFPGGPVTFTEDMLKTAIANARRLSKQAHFLLTHP